MAWTKIERKVESSIDPDGWGLGAWGDEIWGSENPSEWTKLERESA